MSVRGQHVNVGGEGVSTEPPRSDLAPSVQGRAMRGRTVLAYATLASLTLSFLVLGCVRTLSSNRAGWLRKLSGSTGLRKWVGYMDLCSLAGSAEEFGPEGRKSMVVTEDEARTSGIDRRAKPDSLQGAVGGVELEEQDFRHPAAPSKRRSGDVAGNDGFFSRVEEQQAEDESLYGAVGVERLEDQDWGISRTPGKHSEEAYPENEKRGSIREERTRADSLQGADSEDEEDIEPRIWVPPRTDSLQGTDSEDEDIVRQIWGPSRTTRRRRRSYASEDDDSLEERHSGGESLAGAAGGADSGYQDSGFSRSPSPYERVTPEMFARFRRVEFPNIPNPKTRLDLSLVMKYLRLLRQSHTSAKATFYTTFQGMEVEITVEERNPHLNWPSEAAVRVLRSVLEDSVLNTVAEVLNQRPRFRKLHEIYLLKRTDAYNAVRLIVTVSATHPAGGIPSHAEIYV